jgi:hypothetical protein
MTLGEPLRRTSCASRRAIRSISHSPASRFRGWFRYYPSRKNAYLPAIFITKNS